MLAKLASKKPSYYVCVRIERSLRKQRNPTMKQTLFTTETYFPEFQKDKSAFIAI